MKTLTVDDSQRVRLPDVNSESVVVCPISELGFPRIHTNKKAIGASMEDAPKALEKLLSETKVQHIPDDLPDLCGG